jgi:hypothetical protein
MDRHRAPAGVGENYFNALALQALHENLRTIHDFAPFRRSGGFRSGGFFGLHNLEKECGMLSGEEGDWRG